MEPKQITYLVFGIVLSLAVIVDLGLLSTKGKIISYKRALWQTLFWVGLSFAFFVFVWQENSDNTALEYLSAYLMEWSLSIDNIFVFILIFSFFKVREDYYARVLLIGILMAILFRIIFIAVGISLVAKFEWILYIFGVFLVYTGFKMFTSNQEEEFRPEESRVFRFMKKYFRLTEENPHGKFFITHNGKNYFTRLAVVIVMLATTDIIFAVDSIPAVFAISHDPMVVYTSNIFAVLGLRSLFFLLRGAISKFDYLQHGISVVLIFIGMKMLLEPTIENRWHLSLPAWLSLLVIVTIIGGSVVYSIYHKKPGIPKEIKE
jgi:tellurite resistance protein TerC